jgi:hypothetical protein
MKKIIVMFAAGILTGSYVSAQDSSATKGQTRPYDTTSTNSSDSKKWGKNKMNKDKGKNSRPDTSGSPRTDSLRRNEQ